MLEIDFDRVRTDPAGVPRYADSDAPVRIPVGVPVRVLSEARCRSCGGDSAMRTGLVAWLAERSDPRSPTEWITLCDDHFKTTSRPKPASSD